MPMKLGGWGGSWSGAGLPAKWERHCVPVLRDALSQRQLLLAFGSSSPAQMCIPGLAGATGASCLGYCC